MKKPDWIFSSRVREGLLWSFSVYYSQDAWSNRNAVLGALFDHARKSVLHLAEGAVLRQVLAVDAYQGSSSSDIEVCNL